MTNLGVDRLKKTQLYVNLDCFKLTCLTTLVESMKKLAVLGLCVSLSAMAEAQPEGYLTSLDYAQVERVDVTQSENGSWCFAVQVKHNDQGWDHYADAWHITDLAGNVLGKRVLAHPHDNEQPFTRSLCGIEIAEVLQKVVVSSTCNVHGFGGKTIIVDLNKTQGNGFTIKRAK